MSDSIFLSSLFLTSACIILGHYALHRWRSGPLPLPLRPPSYPVIGQLLSMPRRSEGSAFIGWSQRLNSDIISFSFLGKTIIVLNSAEMANDFLERRSSTHSGRYCPPMIASPNLMNMKDFVAFMDTNELWKNQCRTMNARLNKQSVIALRSLQDLEARRLLVRLLKAHTESVSSDFLNEEFYRTTSAVFLESVYGYELKSPQDRFFVDTMTMNANLSKAALPTSFLVNLLHQKHLGSGALGSAIVRWLDSPSLQSSTLRLVSRRFSYFVWSSGGSGSLAIALWRSPVLPNPDVFGGVLPWLDYLPEWIPGAGWKKTAYEWRKQKDRAMGEVFGWAKQRILNGADESSIVALTFKEARGMGWGEAAVDAFCKNVATGLLAAGTESSTLAMLWFVLAMVLHPEVQAKAQKEIDTVVGPNRLPTVEDRIKLPYIDRVLTEIMRWHPAVSLGVPHICTEEGEYRGYRIPKGAIIATVLDERIYKDAHKFEPDRFMDPSVPLPLVFGWGQRICPGQHFFRELFYLEAVMILATMNIERCKGKNGEEIVPTEATTENGAIARPAPFKVKLTPRSEHHAELMRTAV